MNFSRITLYILLLSPLFCLGQTLNYGDKSGAIDVEWNSTFELKSFEYGSGLDNSEIQDLSILPDDILERHSAWIKFPNLDQSTEVSISVKDLMCKDDVDLFLFDESGLILADIAGGQFGESTGDDGSCLNTMVDNIVGDVWLLIHNYHSSNGVILTTTLENSVVGTFDTKEDTNQISVWPNPCQDELRIATSQPVEKINIYSSDGKMCYSGFDKTIDVGRCPVGVLFVETTINNRKVIKKIQKNK